MILFAFWIPHLFYTESTLKALLTTNAVTAIAAIAFLVPFTTLNFDLTVGAMIGVSALVGPSLIVNAGVPMLVGHSADLLICAGIGAFTGALVTVVRISSIITTIAMLSIIDALGSAALGGGQVLGLPSSYLRLTSFQIFGIAMPFYYLIVLGVIVWYVLNQTPSGRYLYAIGGNEEASRLAGIQVRRLVFGTFIASAVIAAIAGHHRVIQRRCRRLFRGRCVPLPGGGRDVFRLHAGQAWNLQCLGHCARRLHTGHRGQGTSARRCAVLASGRR